MIKLFRPASCTLPFVLISTLFFNPSCTSTKHTTHHPLADSSEVAILLVDLQHPISQIDHNIYGQFLEHINHAVVDGLYAEQVQGQGFEGKDFETYWRAYNQSGTVELVDVTFYKGTKSIKLSPANGTVGIQQTRLYIQQDMHYQGSVWVKIQSGQPITKLRILDKKNKLLNECVLTPKQAEWEEVPFSFVADRTDTAALFEISCSGTGTVFIDFISLMRSDALANGKLRVDLLQSLKNLRPSFVRWPGGSFASTYKWQDGIGPAHTRVYHPNTMWGGYADYYGFGTDEFLSMCERLGTDPMIVLPAPSINDSDVSYAMNWVHYLLDPITTSWGKMRAENGHPDPYVIPYIQIDNEPMNNQQNADQYAEIVNVYGSALRKIAPNSKIVSCGQKRSNDLHWSQKIINLAGSNFDILGCHNYEYEPERYQTGIQRIADYLQKLDHFIRYSKHPNIKIAVLEWSLCRSYDWRAGLHAAGSLIAYETMSPSISMTCPALLMRNTTDNPEWRAFIYHDHVSWFPGSGYIVEKLFSEHFAPVYVSSTTGTFMDIENRAVFFDDISQMKPTGWTPGTIDAIATKSEDGQRIVIKAVNYQAKPRTLMVRLIGVVEHSTIQTFTISAQPKDEPSMSNPDLIKPIQGSIPFSKDLRLEMKPYSVLVVEIKEKKQ